MPLTRSYRNTQTRRGQRGLGVPGGYRLVRMPCRRLGIWRLTRTEQSSTGPGWDGDPEAPGARGEVLSEIPVWRIKPERFVVAADGACVSSRRRRGGWLLGWGPAVETFRRDDLRRAVGEAPMVCGVRLVTQLAGHTQTPEEEDAWGVQLIHTEGWGHAGRALESPGAR